MNDSTVKLAVDWVQEAFDASGDLDAAVQAALERVMSAGCAATLFEERGASWLRAEWRQMQHDARVRSQHGPAERRHDSSALADDERSIFDALWEVDGRWLRLGDFRYPETAALADDYRDRAQANAFMAATFERIGSRLGKKTVAKVFTEDALRAMFRETEG